MDDVIPTNIVDHEIFRKLSEERKLFLTGELTPDSATILVANLFLLEKQSESEIIVYINSTGGDVGGLLAIYDTFQCIKSPIKTICIGEAYSAAAVILAAGQKGLRCAYPNSRIMIHDLQLSDLSGSQSELQKESKRIKQDSRSLMEIIASHTGQSLRKVKRDCKTDKYFTAREALAYGLVDEIVKYNKEIPEFKNG